MFSVETAGRWLIFIGVGIALVGGLLLIFGKIPILNQLGKLPGDIRYQSADGRLSCFVPIVSSILLSVLLSVILNLVIRLNR